MDHFVLLQGFLILLLFTFVSSRALFYDQSDENPIDQVSKDNQELLDFESQNKEISAEGGEDSFPPSLDFDSYEEAKFHRRAALSSPHPPRTISPQNRQVLLDILQKAYDQGWRPQLKHYIPATRFGRHRR